MQWLRKQICSLKSVVGGGVFSCMNKGQRGNDNKGAAYSKPESKPSGKPDIKYGICGKGHLTIRCYKNPDRKQAYSR